jgi:hypothetical protein
MYKHRSASRVKISVGHLYLSQWGDCTEMWIKDAPADRVTMACLAKVCNGIKQHRKVHSSFTQTVVKITVGINKQKIIKE